jgi:hypothetical protein
LEEAVDLSYDRLLMMMMMMDDYRSRNSSLSLSHTIRQTENSPLLDNGVTNTPSVKLCIYKKLLIVFL